MPTAISGFVATCVLLDGLSNVCNPVCESLEAMSARLVSANVGELESEQPAIKTSEAAAIPKPTNFFFSIDMNKSPIQH